MADHTRKELLAKIAELGDNPTLTGLDLSGLDLSDINIITDIYPAREKPIKKVTSKLLIDNMKNKNLHYIKNKKNIPKIIKNIIKENDMILVMGAGDIHTIIISCTSKEWKRFA